VHRLLQVARIVELDIHTDMIRKAAGEELCLLVQREAAYMRQSGLERI